MRRGRPPKAEPVRLVVQARVGAALHAALAEAARRSGRSRSQEVVAALLRHLAPRPAVAPPDEYGLREAAGLEPGQLAARLGMAPPLLSKARLLAASRGQRVEEYLAAALRGAVERDYQGLFDESQRPEDDEAA